jgi:hypothetical protein
MGLHGLLQGQLYLTFSPLPNDMFRSHKDHRQVMLLHVNMESWTEDRVYVRISSYNQIIKRLLDYFILI